VVDVSRVVRIMAFSIWLQCFSSPLTWSSQCPPNTTFLKMLARVLILFSVIFLLHGESSNAVIPSLLILHLNLKLAILDTSVCFFCFCKPAPHTLSFSHRPIALESPGPITRCVT
jgi:hypothetical protein